MIRENFYLWNVNQKDFIEVEESAMSLWGYYNLSTAIIHIQKCCIEGGFEAVVIQRANNMFRNADDSIKQSFLITP